MERRKEVRLEHIAAEVGVSIVTVSNALKGKKGVSEELRRTICETAEQMGYRLDHNKGKKRESYMIGVVVAERYVKEFPSFYMDVYKRAAQELTRYGSVSVLEVVNQDQEEMWYDLTAFAGIEIHGIILIGEMNRKYILELKRKCKTPLVCIGCYDVCEEVEYVVTDNYGGMEQMTELLLDAGNRNLMFVGTPEISGNVMDRYLGYCKALEKRGIEVKEENLLHDRQTTGEGNRIEIILPEILPDGFVCNSDKTAAIVIEKLLERGCKIPEEVSVVGFGYDQSRVQIGADLTTYENDEKVIAHIAVSTLIKHLEGRKKQSEVRIVEGKVIMGHTIGSPI